MLMSRSSAFSPLPHVTYAQTSGGLLLAVSPDSADEMVAELHNLDLPRAAVIGQVLDGPPATIEVV